MMYSNFKKILIGLSILCSAQSIITLIMFDQSSETNLLEFLNALFLGLFLPPITFILWIIYGTAKSVNNKKIWITSAVCLCVYILILIIGYFGAILGVPAFYIQYILSLFGSILCIVFSLIKTKEKSSDNESISTANKQDVKLIPFKKALFGLSIFCSLQSLFALMMFMFPSLVGFDDSIGFFTILLSVLFPSFTLLLWILYARRKSVSDKTLCVFATAFLGVHALLSVNNLLDLVPVEFIGFIIQSMMAIFANVLCMVLSTMKKD